MLQRAGYDIIKTSSEDENIDMEASFMRYYEKCAPYTRTSIQRMYSIYNSIAYLVKNNIEGDLVECGTWKGGSAMMMASALKEFNDQNRRIFLYDTYEGMSEPGAKDISYENMDAASLLKTSENDKENSVWCLATIDEVKQNLYATGYPRDKLLFIKGKVEETIPQTVPQKISFLRLDTDWYESTYHELAHLYPLLEKKGVLIIDDYGHWKGARDATDEYFLKAKEVILLNRIDYTGRIGIKS